MSDVTNSAAWIVKCSSPFPSARVHDRGQCVSTSITLNTISAGRNRDQPPHDPEARAARREQVAGQPRGRAEQQQRDRDQRDQQVLHHVDAVVRLLGEVVDRPVGRQPDREHAERAARDLEPRDDRVARRRVARADPHHCDPVARGEQRRRAATRRGAGSSRGGDGERPTSASVLRTRGASQQRRRSTGPSAAMIPRMKNRRKIGWSVRRCMYYARDEDELHERR